MSCFFLIIYILIEFIVHRMEREVVLWAVVLFPNGGTATVLSSWFNAKEGTLFWPPKNINYSKALKENMMPRKGWTTYENVRLLNTCGK